MGRTAAWKDGQTAEGPCQRLARGRGALVELDSPQQADLELQPADDLMEAVDVSQQAAGVADLRGVDLRVVRLHARQAEHVTAHEPIGLCQELLSPPPACV